MKSDNNSCIKYLLLAVFLAMRAQAEPVAPGWIAKDPSQWPQILLANNARFKNNTQTTGASGFLMKLPNGAVVAATATHILGDEIDPANLDALLVSWTMSPRTMPQKKVTLKKIAMAADQAQPLDCLLMSVIPATPWPVEVLVAREQPVEVGEVIYLIAVSYEEKSSQHVYKGKVTQRIDASHEFGFEFEGTVETRGFSGAPVIDANGQVVGIHHGKFNDQPGGGKILAAANAIRFAIDVANAPAVAAADVTKKPAGSAPVSADPASASTSDGSAEKATRDLGMAKNYITVQRYDAARAKLQKLMEAYPKTGAAKEAKKLLEDIEGK